LVVPGSSVLLRSPVISEQELMSASAAMTLVVDRRR